MDLETVKKRTKWAIDYVIENKHLSNVKLAEKMKTAPGTINSYRTMTTVPNIEFVLKFCELFGFSLLWFMDGIGYPFKGAWETHPESKGPNTIPNLPDIAGLFGPDADSPFVPLREDHPEKHEGEFVYIPQMVGGISAGRGMVPDERVDVKLAFRKEWLRRKGDPARMSSMKVSGDSMEPTLLSGDIVLIDHSRDYIDPAGGLYAVAVNDSIMIKRLHVDIQSNKVKIISDNAKYPIIEIEADQVQVNGKVVWFGREIER